MNTRLRFLVLVVFCALASSCGKSEWRPLKVSQGGFQILRSGIAAETGHDPEAEACAGLRVRRIGRR